MKGVVDGAINLKAFVLRGIMDILNPRLRYNMLWIIFITGYILSNYSMYKLGNTKGYNEGFMTACDKCTEVLKKDDEIFKSKFRELKDELKEKIKELEMEMEANEKDQEVTDIKANKDKVI